ncbi:hypothetical protein WUBG_10940 [Wuchereria bancrofti]|uniref:Uncharacterized protein n=1 Tax=Wuchereria bancrofti TaxID=6293 RepID=J9AUJ7_WUCBA|nr:hypothetical protein WUBG_10940 [Wuchereria bancrofti]
MKSPQSALFTLFFCIFGTGTLLATSQRFALVDNNIEDDYLYTEPADIYDDDFDDSDNENDPIFTDITLNYTTLTFLSTSQDTVSPLAMTLLTYLMHEGYITDAALPWNTGRPLVLRLNRTTAGQNDDVVTNIQVV